MPIASILIPVFNRSKYIKNAILSALNQTVVDIEVIVVDNASSDETYHICEELASRDSRLKVFRNKENIGPVRNWIRAAELATSPYSKLLFSDDLLAPTFLERCLPYLADKNCGIVYTPAIIGKEDWNGKQFYNNFIGNIKIKRSAYIQGSIFIEHLFPVSPCSSISRTEDLQNNFHLNLSGFEMDEYASTGAGVDWLYHSLTMLKYEFIQYIDNPEVFFRSHEGSLSALPVTNKCYANAKKFLKGALQLKNSFDIELP